MEARLEQPFERFKAALDDLSSVAARTMKANIACIIQCNRKRARVLGATGTNVRELSGGTEFPALQVNHISVFNELQKQAWFHRNSLASIVATVNRLLIVKLETHFEEEIYLAVFDPSRGQLKDTASLASVSEVARIAAAFVNHAAILASIQEAQLPVKEARQEFREELQASIHSTRPEESSTHPLVSFLMRSLIVKKSLRSRKACTYVSLRTWRAAAKNTQLDALQVLRSELTPPDAKPIAVEIAAEIQVLYANAAFEAVTCIPSGPTIATASFSEVIAQEVAKVLGLDFVIALEVEKRTTQARGKSNYKSLGFEVIIPIKGPVLLLCDLATSGHRMERAMSALRQRGCFPFGIAWIGG